MGLFGKKEPLTDQELYGKAWLDIVSGKKRDRGLSQMKELHAKGFHEASVAVAMFTPNITTRADLLQAAANAGNAEGLWEIATIMSHAYKPDFNDSADKAWIEQCIKAANRCSADAMNELGNIYSRREEYPESMYWYAMANAYDHPQGQVSMMGVARKWKASGASRKVSNVNGYLSDNQIKCAIAYLEMNAGEEVSLDPDEAVRLTMEGLSIAGYFAGDIFEGIGNLEMAYKIYNALAFANDPHGLKCLADMMMNGMGTAKDVNAAIGIYQKAAELGERTAMFIMGELYRSNKKKELAAYWYGLAHVRGYEHALTRLMQMA